MGDDNKMFRAVKFYRFDHSWIDLKNGHCGITRHAFRNLDEKGLVPIRYHHFGDKLRSIRKNELVGMITMKKLLHRSPDHPHNMDILCQQRGLLSPVNGQVIKINQQITLYQTNLNSHWLYQVDPDSIVEFNWKDFMDYESYTSYIRKNM